MSARCSEQTPDPQECCVSGEGPLFCRWVCHVCTERLLASFHLFNFSERVLWADLFLNFWLLPARELGPSVGRVWAASPMWVLSVPSNYFSFPWHLSHQDDKWAFVLCKSQYSAAGCYEFFVHIIPCYENLSLMSWIGWFEVHVVLWHNLYY